MRFRGRALKAYVVASLAVLALHYLVPYTVLHGAEGFTLYAFWSILAATWVVATVVFVSWGWLER